MRAGSAITSGTRHVFGVTLQALLIAAIVAALSLAAAMAAGGNPAGAGSVLAAKGGHNAAATSAISLDQASTSLSLGSPVTFTTTVAGLTSNEYPLVYLKCVQGGDVVYGQLASPSTTFVLGGGSSAWWQVGGGATCVAQLDAYGTHGGSDTIRVLAQTAPFSAN